MRFFVISLLIVGALFCAEPALRNKEIFAVSIFNNNPKVDYNKIEDSTTVIKTPARPPVQERSHAPEPTTMILFLGGISTMIVRYLQKSFERLKRVIDFILSVIGLTISLPIVALTAILIKLDSPGPIIYKQKRLGKYGQTFWIYKFRTMGINAEKGTGAIWAKKNDPRVTKVGKFLRKSRIDEIPQLINVIKGEMSIVGPRPERPEIVRDLKTLIKDYETRLAVKPGITGLAQVEHKYDESIDDVRIKIKYDNLYIKDMNLNNDLKILAKTCFVVLTGKGAQ